MSEVVERMDVRTSRRFKRTASLGMKVWRSMTINFNCGYLIEHIELACPNYELTPNGPEYKRKKAETE